MVAAHDAPLEQRPHVLDAICVNVTLRYVLLIAMLDCLVFGVLVCDPTIGGPLVGVDGFGVASGVLTNEAVLGFPVGSPNHLKADIAIALHSTYHNGLVALVAPSLAFHPATYEGFVNLYDALKKLSVNLVKSSAYAVREIPSRLVGRTNGAL